MARPAKAYSDTAINTAVESANSKELILLVYEKIIDHLKVGKKELEINQPGVIPFTRACDLINLGLIASLDKVKGGEIANNLELIYLWAIHKITEARLNKAADKLDEVVKVFDNLADGWRQI